MSAENTANTGSTNFKEASVPGIIESSSELARAYLSRFGNRFSGRNNRTAQNSAAEKFSNDPETVKVREQFQQDEIELANAVEKYRNLINSNEKYIEKITNEEYKQERQRLLETYKQKLQDFEGKQKQHQEQGQKKEEAQYARILEKEFQLLGVAEKERIANAKKTFWLAINDPTWSKRTLGIGRKSDLKPLVMSKRQTATSIVSARQAERLEKLRNSAPTYSGDFLSSLGGAVKKTSSSSAVRVPTVARRKTKSAATQDVMGDIMTRKETALEGLKKKADDYRKELIRDLNQKNLSGEEVKEELKKIKSQVEHYYAQGQMKLEKDFSLEYYKNIRQKNNVLAQKEKTVSRQEARAARKGLFGKLASALSYSCKKAWYVTKRAAIGVYNGFERAATDIMPGATLNEHFKKEEKTSANAVTAIVPYDSKVAASAKMLQAISQASKTSVTLPKKESKGQGRDFDITANPGRERTSLRDFVLGGAAGFVGKTALRAGAAAMFGPVGVLAVTAGIVGVGLWRAHRKAMALPEDKRNEMVPLVGKWGRISRYNKTMAGSALSFIAGAALGSVAGHFVGGWLNDAIALSAATQTADVSEHVASNAIHSTTDGGSYVSQAVASRDGSFFDPKGLDVQVNQEVAKGTWSSDNYRMWQAGSAGGNPHMDGMPVGVDAKINGVEGSYYVKFSHGIPVEAVPERPLDVLNEVKPSAKTLG